MREQRGGSLRTKRLNKPTETSMRNEGSKTSQRNTTQHLVIQTHCCPQAKIATSERQTHLILVRNDALALLSSTDYALTPYSTFFISLLALCTFFVASPFLPPLHRPFLLLPAPHLSNYFLTFSRLLNYCIYSFCF